jgi:hypothetical protein
MQSQPPRLPRRPEARTFTVERLMEFAREGRLRLPRFQRRLRWRTEHVLELFDSLYQGYPVGELLFSKAEAAEDAPMSFGRVVIPARKLAEGYFVVDGQQRLTALAGALLHPDAVPRGDMHAVWFDVERGAFERLIHREAPAAWVPLNLMLDSVALHEWVDAWPLRRRHPEKVRQVFDLARTLREYAIPTYLVEGASEEGLRLIFKRVNTSGVSMSESEVFEALHGSQRQAPLGWASQHLAGLGMGSLDEDWLLRCLKAVEGLSPKHSFKSADRSDDALPAVERTVAALERTLRFLSEDVGIPHLCLLPYRMPLILLARFFHLHPAPLMRLRVLLARWVWRGAASGAHADSSHATVARLQAAITPDDPAAAVEALLKATPSTIEPLKDDEPWNARSAKTKLAALMYLGLQPRDFGTGQPYDPDFIRAQLDQHGLSGMFTFPPHAQHSVYGVIASPYAHKLDDLAQAPLEVLQSHRLDPSADFWEEHDGELRFFARPWYTAHDLYEHHTTARTQNQDHDRPPIASILARVQRRLGLSEPSREVAP